MSGCPSPLLPRGGGQAPWVFHVMETQRSPKSSVFHIILFTFLPLVVFFFLKITYSRHLLEFERTLNFWEVLLECSLGKTLLFGKREMAVEEMPLNQPAAPQVITRYSRAPTNPHCSGAGCVDSEVMGCHLLGC